jgi:glucose-6-phosphate dehydrogenase assembly protein OpcA
VTTYISEFSVSGAPNRDELKVTLQGLLASRLNRDQVQRVESAAKAAVTLTGSYAVR